MDDPTLNDCEKTRKIASEDIASDTSLTGRFSLEDVFWKADLEAGSQLPSRIAEFEIGKLLGRGGFGTVYEAYDTILQRQVAIKIPHRTATNQPSSDSSDLHEARAIASLDHQNIVPVYQASSTPEVPLYIVVRLIDGRTLLRWAADVQPSFSQIAEVVSTIADALGYAHARNVIHRDIKPSNILVDKEGRAYVADFGLALRELNLDQSPAYIGTPAYMSPEQARGEGHRVDHRSDIFALGIVLYQLLTQQLPFVGSKPSELLNAIKSIEPDHPCRVNPRVPPELARICLRALTKSLNGRYQRAEEMAAELREYCRSVLAIEPTYGRYDSADRSNSSARLSASDELIEQESIRVVPKGLRAFESSDSDFFLRLVPGPYDRQGLPAVVRFWKSRLESRVPSEVFSVGVAYGPSGCGKTSIFRAGLLPRLNRDILTIYVEADATSTEKSLVSSITNLVAGIDFSADPRIDSDEQYEIVRLFAGIRRSSKRKVVICIDQFEQWLYGNSANLEQSALAHALRHCDGVNLQCVLMVRDDFWMGISRLMQTLDIPISENINASSVDLFDKQHARKVLGLFGVAYLKLSPNESKWSSREQAFLTSAIDYLAVDGRVICVQLALLAEMMKHRDWNNPSLFNREGGAGLGVAFFEQMFESETAPKRYRSHSDGAQRLLRQLLPEPGAKIKGSMQAEGELRSAVAYPDEAAFRELIRILDSELHLITPTTKGDPDSYTSSSWSRESGSLGETGYQLTHDFLITPLRKWLDMRRMRSRSGQAQTRLEEYTELYRVRPQSSSLPTLYEYLQIQWWLPNNTFNDAQSRMMTAAKRHYLSNLGKLVAGLSVLMAIVGLGFQEMRKQQQKYLDQAQADRLVDSSLAESVKLSASLEASQVYVWQALHRYYDDSQTPVSRRVKAALALANQLPKDRDPDLSTYLLDYLLMTSPDEVNVITRSNVLKDSLVLDEVRDRYLQELNVSPEIQLRLASLLAQNSNYHDSLLKDSNRIIRLLMSQNPLHLSDWIEIFKPVSEGLLPSLESEFHKQAQVGGAATVNLANLLIRYADLRPEVLARAIGSAEPTSHALLVAGLNQSASGTLTLQNELKKLDLRLQDHWSSELAGEDWWNHGLPADSERSTIDPNIVQELESIDAIVDPNFIMMFDANREQLASNESRLKEFGFRVAAICPIEVDNWKKAFVLFKRDRRTSLWEWGLTASELLRVNADFHSKGFSTADLSEYSDDGFTSSKFACVWTDTAPFRQVIDTGIYLDVPSEDHERLGWRQYVDQGFVPRTNFLKVNQSGQEFYTSLRWKLVNWMPTTDHWNDGDRDLPKQLGQLRPDDLLVDAHLVASDRGLPDRGLSHLWWSGMPIQSEWVPYVHEEAYRNQCKDLASRGFRPFSIHATKRMDSLECCSVWWKPFANIENHTRLIKQKVRLLLALHSLGDSAQLLATLGGNDADLRGTLIDACARYNVDPSWLARHLVENKVDSATYRAIASALALTEPDSVTTTARSLLQDYWEQIIQSHRDPGIRSALKALHRNWNLVGVNPIEVRLSNQELFAINGKRLVILDPPDEFQLGSNAGEPGRNGYKERLRTIKMPRRYAIATEEVTAAEFLQFKPDHTYSVDYCPTTDCPMIDITWFDAAKYCRWLSEKQGLPESEMCYPPIDEIESGMVLAANYLDRTGYRLPTEAEWEFAARGGVSAGRFFGFVPELLNHYAWTAENSSYRAHQVGRLLPNDYGIFDIFGNAMEMCQHPMVTFTENSMTPLVDPAELHLEIQSSDIMASRGGAILFQPLDARAAHRDDHPAGETRPYLSFRIARTVRE